MACAASRAALLLSRAALLESQGHINDAGQSLEAALSLAPRHAQATAALQRVLRAQKNWAALAELLSAEAPHTSPAEATAMYAELADLYLDRLEQPGPAEAALRQALRLSPSDAAVRRRLVSLVADRVGVMYLGRIVELQSAAKIFSEPRHPYTRMLLDAVPDLGMTGKPRTPVAGEVPNPLAPPSGCAFHPRCPHANERCRAEAPRFQNGVACHAVAEGRI